MTRWVNPHYIDASAIVSVYVDEDYSDAVRAFPGNHPKPFFTTALCVGEALNVFK